MIIDASIRRMMKPGQPEWLTRLQNDLALLTADAQRERLARPDLVRPNYNQRLEHIQQVERDGLKVAETIPSDRDALIAAVWIYDRCGAGAEVDAIDIDENSARCAADWTRQNLAGYGFPADKVETVAAAVGGILTPPGALPDSLIEARQLWDAVRLSSIGPLHIVTYLTTHPAFPEQRLSYTSLALHGLEQLEHTRRLVECLYFEVSRRIAHRRYEHQKMFYEALARDVEA